MTQELQKYDTLLFQLDSEYNEAMWGDMGIGNFFISEQDLFNWDFSDIFLIGIVVNYLLL